MTANQDAVTRAHELVMLHAHLRKVHEPSKNERRPNEENEKE